MFRLVLPATVMATALLLALPEPAEARHARSMHGWCRADAAQMMGISRRVVSLERRVVRIEGGRRILRGMASHGALGVRPFACHFDRRGVLQGAV
ncbi:hypothetical protein [Phreatobacter sp.]|uniref:hypothetical protein n=1 Tax=Phreatobacter sp. TaxID=1966341 RepID=UPI003F71299F